jgi:hypothetical protein
MLGKRAPLIVAILATVGGLILVCLFGLLLVNPRGILGEGNGIDDQAGNGTPTPTIEIVPAGTTLPPVVIGIQDETGAVTVTLNSPTRLAVGGSSFAIQGQRIEPDGIWARTSTLGEGSAVWVYGTVINYIIGMLDSDANRTLLNQLQPGDEIVMTKSDGSTFTFAVSGRQVVPQSNRDIFAQNTPGITLVLLEEGNTSGQDRTVVQGRYVVAETSSDVPGPVEIGETAQLDDLQITAIGASFVFDRPEIPPGFAFYLVDYQIQNTGATAVDTSQLRLVLTDEVGNQYALNPTASQLGNNPMLAGLLGAGQTVQATAGYQVPVALNSANLRWIVTHTETDAEIQVNIPFGAGNDAGDVSVTLQQGTVSLDGTSLLLVGQITNLGSQPLVVEGTDLFLESEGTFHLLLSTNPGFPWVVGPGQTLPFSVTFQRPVGSSAVFSLLNQPFQLNGLR